MSDFAAAQNPRFQQRVRQQVEAFARNTPYHSLELNDGTVIPGIIPVEQLRARLNAFPLPRDLTGKRVLDIGAASGWNSFELERRGADVAAVDCVEYDELVLARRLLDSRIEYLIMDVEEMTPARLGTFDYVIFFGVLYHLRHPLLGLERVCALAREAAFVESFVVDAEPDASRCYLEFYETTELGGQLDNWFGPTTHCLLSMCRSAGFPRVELRYVNDRRAGVTCYRQVDWDASATGPAPLLCFAVNNRRQDIFFSPPRDEYISIYFKTEREVTLSDVAVDVDQFGVPPLTLTRHESSKWQVDVRVPGELAPGTHMVRVRTRGSGYSNALSIVVFDPALPRPALAGFVPQAIPSGPATRLIAIENSMDGSASFQGYRSEFLSAYFESPKAELDLSAVQLEIDGHPWPILAVGRSSETVWQIKAKLGESLAAGFHQLRVRTAAGGLSDLLEFEFAPESLRFM